MAGLLSLQNYDSDSDASDEEKKEYEGHNAHLKPVDSGKATGAIMAIVAAPEVESNVRNSSVLFKLL